MPLRLNCPLLSLAGPVTYPKATDLREVARQIPLDRMMIETDCPLLPPQKFRGKRNEPSYVRYAAADELPVAVDPS